MAERDKQKEVLARPGGWQFKVKSGITLRRALFADDDMFYFTVDPQNADRLALYVCDSGNDPVLGEKLTLQWYEPATGFVVNDYGRHMEFWVDGNDRNGWSMHYNGMYMAPPHHAPDEGGDGDPK